MDEHLGYSKHDSAGRNGGNSGNGTRSKTVINEVGRVDIDVPRHRDSTFEPATVKKRQRRLNGVDSMVISLTAKGLTAGEVQAHLAETYGTDASRELPLGAEQPTAVSRRRPAVSRHSSSDRRRRQP